MLNPKLVSMKSFDMGASFSPRMSMELPKEHLQRLFDFGQTGKPAQGQIVRIKEGATPTREEIFFLIFHG